MTTLNSIPYTFGGMSGDSKTHFVERPKYDNVYMYSFDINEWLDRARIPVTTVAQAVIALDDDTALMCGGYNQLTHGMYRVCCIYTTSTNGVQMANE
jgi:N-acetylneuraminic acid mutarotase